MPQDSRGFASDPFDIGFDTVSNIRNYGFDETVPLIIRYTPFSLFLYIYMSPIVESVVTLSQLARYVSRLIMEIPLMANLGYVSINVYTHLLFSFEISQED